MPGAPRLPGSRGHARLVKLRGYVFVDGHPLTPRQAEVARLATHGLMNKEIAVHLGIDVTTVRNHMTKAFRALGVGRRTELAVLLFRAGAAGPDPRPEANETPYG